MAEEQSRPGGPDLTQGVALADFVDGKLAGHVGDQEVLLVRAATRYSPSPPIARIITARSPTGSWSTTPFAVPGITPVSICAPAKRCALRP